MQGKFKPKPKLVLREGVLEGDSEGLFWGGETVRFAISDNRCHASIYKERRRDVLVGARRACVYLGSHSYSFGSDEPAESSLGGVLLDFGIISFKAEEIVLGLDFVFRDKYGDRAFTSLVELVVLYFN